jgi:hypothetical protein
MPAITSTVPSPTQAVKGSPKISTPIKVVDTGPTMPVCAAMAQLFHNWGRVLDTASSIEQDVALAQLRTPKVLISGYRLRTQRTSS